MRAPAGRAETATILITIVFVAIAIALLLAALPTWPYSQGWGYYPAGGFALIIVILILLAAVGWM